MPLTSLWAGLKCKLCDYILFHLLFLKIGPIPRKLPRGPRYPVAIFLQTRKCCFWISRLYHLLKNKQCLWFFSWNSATTKILSLLPCWSSLFGQSSLLISNSGLLVDTSKILFIYFHLVANGLPVSISYPPRCLWMITKKKRGMLILFVCVLSRSGRVWLFVTVWTVACQAPLSMGFCRQEYWSGLPRPPPGDLPDPGIEPMSPTSPALAGGFFYH